MIEKVERIPPLKIAHRGGAGLRPENTLAAFQNAIDLGMDGIELDVHLSKDNKLVVHHDESLNPAIARDESGRWLEEPTPLIKDLTFAELQRYDLGRLQENAEYAARFPDQKAIDGVRIPSLESVIDLIESQAQPGFRLYLELKTDPLDPDRSAHPVKLAEAAVECIEARSIHSNTTYVSFDWLALQTVRKKRPQAACRFTTHPFMSIDPDHPSANSDKPGSFEMHIRALSKNGCAWTAGVDWRKEPGADFAEKTLNSVKSAGGEGWFAYFADVTEETMAIARKLGLKVCVWTVDLEDDMVRMAKLGVEAILTDRPDKLSAVKF